MKKLLLFLLTVSLFSCSGDDSSDSTTNISFNPPSWIQGRWLMDTNAMEIGYKFSSDDFCLVNYNSDYCYKESINQMQSVGSEANINEEIISETEYKFSFTVSNGTSNYHFIKVSPTRMKTILNSTEIYYNKQ